MERLEIPGVEREAVVIPDVHADPEALWRSLFQFGLVDIAGKWIGEDSKVVFCGDYIDRGGRDLEVLDYLIDLEEQIKGAGGEVDFLVGNHEMMVLSVLNSDHIMAQRSWQKMMMINPSLAESLCGKEVESPYEFGREMYVKYFKFFNNLKVVSRFGSILCVHGAVNLGFALKLEEHGVDGINRAFYSDLIRQETSYWNTASKVRRGKETVDGCSPLWADYKSIDPIAKLGGERYEYYSFEALIEIADILEFLGISMVVSGHTILDEVSFITRMAITYVGIDVGMSSFYCRSGNSSGGIKVTECFTDNGESLSVSVDYFDKRETPQRRIFM